MTRHKISASIVYRMNKCTASDPLDTFAPAKNGETSCVCNHVSHRFPL
jgi:hypothetical protein